MLSTNALGGLTADVISAISSFREGQRRVTGWETAIRAEDCPDTSWEHMPKEVPMISVEKGEGIPGEVLRSCRNNLWIRASTGSASGD